MSLFTKRRKSLSMKHEDKDLLFKDLCSRLPYNTKVKAFIGEKSEADEILSCVHILNFYAYNCKPYLRPMSSMTKDEQEEFFNLIICVDNGKAVIEEDKIDAYNNFIYSHHLDNKNFIEMGLAIKAPEGMYLY